MSSSTSKLKSFQNEMESISRQYNQPVPAKSIVVPTSPQGSKGKGKELTAEGDQVASIKKEAKAPQLEAEPHSTTDEEHDRLQTLLLDEPALPQARDLLAHLLLRAKGEIVLPLGRHPPLAQLWVPTDVPISLPAGEQGKAEDGWRGPYLTTEVHLQAMQRLRDIVDEIGGFDTALFQSTQPPRSFHLLRLPATSVESTIEVRCAVVGNVDSGKSTTLGVLTRGALDDGRGKARGVLFRHKHEMETGRTSSVGMEILGFSAEGHPILPSYHVGTTEANTGYDKLAFAPATARREKMGWDEISARASRIVSFIDLAGHERYLKTSLFGLTSGAPDCVLLMVGGNAGMIGMSKEHLAIALALSVPVIVAITKVDMTPPNVLEETKKQVMKILRSPGCRKTPVFVKNLETAIEISQTFTKDRSVCPVFMLSNVTGEGLELFRTLLNLVPSSEGDQEKYPVDQPLEYAITEVWSVPHVGTVVNGLIASGKIHAGDPILFGPDSTGAFQSSVVKSIQRKRAPVNSAEAGQCVSFALKRVRRAAVRKGMVIVQKTEVPPKAVRRFEGQVLILYHNSTLQRNYQAMLHCGAVRQTVRIISMDNPQGILRTGDRATVEFEFMTHPEFIKAGMKLLFREGKTKGLGVVTRILP
ncbi:hypothetical protein FRB96_001552 [Tulasnella sp. 330]|nr:hypothetical protein FRB96_001552 [Tulasnella sp. 330]KAG8890728.1 hypothetical protein FRB98_006232 [Tulasnella sp. 332]